MPVVGPPQWKDLHFRHLLQEETTYETAGSRGLKSLPVPATESPKGHPEIPNPVACGARDIIPNPLAQGEFWGPKEEN